MLPLSCWIDETKWTGANNGRGHQPRLNVRQVLESEELPCRFFVVLLNPETGKRVASVPIVDLEPDSMVELAIERQTFFPVD